MSQTVTIAILVILIHAPLVASLAAGRRATTRTFLVCGIVAGLLANGLRLRAESTAPDGDLDFIFFLSCGVWLLLIVAWHLTLRFVVGCIKRKPA